MENKPNILIVDDDIEIVEIISSYIKKRYEANIDTKFNGKDAIEATENKKYDVILLDVKMPGMDGIELLTKIREKDKSVHAIMITSWHSAEVVNHAMSAGANAFLVKPVKPELLKTRIDSALSSINKLKHLL